MALLRLPALAMLMAICGCVTVKSYREMVEECRQIAPNDYDRCMAGEEREARAAQDVNYRRRVAAGAALRAMGDGMQNAPRPTTCTTSYYGNQAYTTCQ